MEGIDTNLTDEEALKNFLLDIDCLNELQPWTGHFNLFDVLKISRIEIRHSNVLSWLMNPNENHGMGDAFLKAVVQEMVVNDTKGRYDVFQTLLLDFYNFTVYREWKYIDILLISDQDQFLIAFENKIGAQEHSNQLQRYRENLETVYPDYQKMLIFLTPDGDDPSDTKNWDVLSYSTIADILLSLKDKLELQPDVKLMIENYLEVIRRDIVEDQELIQICTKIYAKHKKALDLIYEYRPNDRTQYLDAIQSALEKAAEEGRILYSKDSSNGSSFLYHTITMDQYLPRLKIKDSSWGTDFIYQYWIRFRENKVCGIFEIGGWNVPEKSMENMQRMIGILKPNDKRKEKFRFKRLFRTKWYEVKESEHMQEDFFICTKRVIEELHHQEKDLLSKMCAQESEHQ